MKAMRTSHWVVREIADRDRDQIQMILHSMEAIRKALDERYDEMRNITVLCAKRKIPNVFRTFPREGTAIQVSTWTIEKTNRSYKWVIWCGEITYEELEIVAKQMNLNRNYDLSWFTE